MNIFDFQFILPEIVLIVAAVILLLVSIFTDQRRILGSLALGGIAASMFILLHAPSRIWPVFSNMLVDDAFATFFRVISLVIAALIVLLSLGYKGIQEDEKGEYYFFILTTTVSMMLAAAANNLMMIYIALEAISLVSYILAGYIKRDIYSSEAGLKYFLFGAFSTGVTLYGISLVYGLFGTLDLGDISQHIVMNGISQPALILAFLLVIVGFGFKCSLAPFHMWTPDVYEGAPTPVAAFFSVGPKAVGFVFLIRLFINLAHPAFLGSWVFIAGTIAAITMIIGNVVALKQENVKRLLAYSTIAQAGYILIGLCAGTSAGLQSVLFYIFIYSFMNLGAFGVVIAVSNAVKGGNVEDFAGLYKRAPFLAVVLAISFLSLAGIPPLAGFMAKFLVLAAVVEQGLMGLAIIAALNSVIALYYYVKVVKFAFLHEPPDSTVVVTSRAVTFALTVIAAAVVVLGVWPHPLLNWILKLLSF